MLNTSGPPVMTIALLCRATATAPRWEGESVRVVFCSTRGDSTCWVNDSPGEFSFEQSQEMGRHPNLSSMEWRQEEARLPIDLFSNEMLLLAFECNCLCNHSGRNLQLSNSEARTY